MKSYKKILITIIICLTTVAFIYGILLADKLIVKEKIDIERIKHEFRDRI